MHEHLEEVMDEKGYLYYHHKTKKINFKEHPKLLLILEKMKELDVIKVDSYRIAKKLIRLKKELFTYYIPFNIVKNVLSLHRFGEANDCPLLRPNELTALLHDIFFAAEKSLLFSECQNFDLKTAVSVLSNLMWNIFDCKRSTSISLMEFKLTLLVLCDFPQNYNEIKKEHFLLVKNHNDTVSRIRLESLLTSFGKLIYYVGETLYLEANVVQEIITECYESSPGPSGLMEFQFIKLWELENKSKFSVYTILFVILLRMKKSENVVHQYQCAGCQVFPIQGLRFKCQRCKNLSLCFNCFSKGFRTKKHPLSHRILELNSVEPPNRSKLFNLLQKIRNLFTRTDSIPITNINCDAFNKTKLIENETIQLMRVEDFTIETGHSNIPKSIDQDVFSQIVHQKQQEKLNEAIQIITNQTNKFESHLESNKQSLAMCNHEFSRQLLEHKQFLKNYTILLGKICESVNSKDSENRENALNEGTVVKANGINSAPYSSTPYRQPIKSMNVKANNISSPLVEKSIHGAEINRTYLDENKCDYSVSDLSSWFQTKTTSEHPQRKVKDLDLKTIDDVVSETELNHFRELLLKVKEIIDDSYSDNTDLAKTTHDLENALHRIIDDEEKKRVL